MRIDVPVSIAYGADLDRVREVLLAAARRDLPVLVSRSGGRRHRARRIRRVRRAPGLGRRSDRPGAPASSCCSRLPSGRSTRPASRFRSRSASCTWSTRGGPQSAVVDSGRGPLLNCPTTPLAMIVEKRRIGNRYPPASSRASSSSARAPSSSPGRSNGCSPKRRGHVLVDLGEINYIDSTGIGELVGYLGKFHEPAPPRCWCTPPSASSAARGGAARRPLPDLRRPGGRPRCRARLSPRSRPARRGAPRPGGRVLASRSSPWWSSREGARSPAPAIRPGRWWSARRSSPSRSCRSCSRAARRRSTSKRPIWRSPAPRTAARREHAARALAMLARGGFAARRPPLRRPPSAGRADRRGAEEAQRARRTPAAQQLLRQARRDAARLPAARPPDPAGYIDFDASPGSSGSGSWRPAAAWRRRRAPAASTAAARRLSRCRRAPWRGATRRSPAPAPRASTRRARPPSGGSPRRWRRHPGMVAGPGRFTTALIAATGGRVVGKEGAEGVYAVAPSATAGRSAWRSRSPTVGERARDIVVLEFSAQARRCSRRGEGGPGPLRPPGRSATIAVSRSGRSSPSSSSTTP